MLRELCQVHYLCSLKLTSKEKVVGCAGGNSFLCQPCFLFRQQLTTDLRKWKVKVCADRNLASLYYLESARPFCAGQLFLKLCKDINHWMTFHWHHVGSNVTHLSWVYLWITWTQKLLSLHWWLDSSQVRCPCFPTLVSCVKHMFNFHVTGTGQLLIWVRDLLRCKNHIRQSYTPGIIYWITNTVWKDPDQNFVSYLQTRLPFSVLGTSSNLVH